MIEELRFLGMTEGEISLYTALLRLGPSTNGPLARHTGLQSSTVYYCLHSLLEKGFVTSVNKGNRKHFMATDPRLLPSFLDKEAEILREKSLRVQKIIPMLTAQRDALEEKTLAEVYEGINGMRMVFSLILGNIAPGEVYEAFVIEQASDDSPELRDLLMKHNLALKKKRSVVRLIAPKRLRWVFEKMYGKKFLKSHLEIRYVEEATPVGISLFRNYVITTVIENGKPMAFVVRNQKLAETYREYFYSLWSK